MVVALLAANGATSAVSAGPRTGDGSVTPVEGPPPPGGAIVPPFVDLAQLGYSASEFFFEGDADSYHNVGSLTNTAEWGVAPDGARQPFKTRFQVLTPERPRNFNGTVYVEWFNVSAGRDSSPDWTRAFTEIDRQGAIYVGISAQAIGVNQAKAQYPDRYGSLVHPGDSYSYDIYSQVGQALRDQAGAIFGPAFEPERFIAMGHSQSGSRLVTYVNAFGGNGVYDGFLPRGTGANPSAPLRQSPLEQITPPSPTLITNFDKPVLREQSETESRAARQEDSGNFRWWEAAGTSHVDAYGFAFDDGRRPDGAMRMFDFMITPFTGPFAEFGHCRLGVNAGPGAWIIHASLRHMNAWVRNGTPPPSAPRLATVDGTPTGALVLDEHGNAVGGIRSPHLDVPIATLTGTGNEAAAGSLNFCAQFGTTTPFSAEKLAELYPNHAVFVIEWGRAVNDMVRAGFMTREDAWLVWLSSVRSDIGNN